MAKVVDWLDERAGIRSLWRHVADEPIPGGARLRYVFGSVLTYLFLQQALLGVLLALYYSPSATDAWASTAYLNDQVAGGWFLRGLHHHGSSAMVIVLVLHFVQVTWAGAYRRPRELGWWTGLLMAAIVLAFALTGYLLPWDQKGYWATQVATSIMGTVPGGEPLRVVVQGGNEYGNLTLTRFYALHVFVLPGLLLALLVAHVALFRRHGVTPPADLSPSDLQRRKVHFIPHQLLLDVTAMAVTAGVLVWITLRTHGAELFAPAQPTSNFVARPEWYFLFLFQLLKYFEGPLQIVATVLIPGAVAVFLMALPWIDRAQSRRARERMPILLAVAALMAAVATLTGIALEEDRADEGFQKGLAAAQEEAESARHWALQGVLPAGGEAVFRNDPEYQARALFEEKCSTCHTVGMHGGEDGPALTDYSSRAWLTALIRNPNAARFFGNTDHDLMDPYPPDDLPDDKLAAVVEYLVSLMGDSAHDATLAARGKALFEDELDCSMCHETAPGKAGDGPNLHGHGTAAWVAALIRDPSQPALFGKAAQMPRFEGKLTPEEIDMLARYVVSQRKRGTAHSAASGPAGESRVPTSVPDPGSPPTEPAPRSRPDLE